MKKNNQQCIIKDPVYGTMSITREEHEFIKPFIDHPTVQRLRHIKQLSFVDLVFPGAVNTRFNHSLGCSYLCSRIYKQLRPQEKELSESHKLIILAGLLHDIGHGPFSHSFEEVAVFKDKTISHEDWFKYFIRDLFSSNNHEIKKHKSLEKKLIDVFSGKYHESWLKTALSSQVDADRMDYLLRDSLFCGVKYGIYDLDWLISCLSLDKDNHLFINEKGIGSAEQFLHARYLMHKNVYFNLKANAIAHCVIDFLDNLVAGIENYQKELTNNKLLNFIISISKNKTENKEKIMENIYVDYKNLVDFDIWMVIRELAISKGESVCHQLARRLYERKLPKACGINPSSVDFVKNLVNSLREKAQLKPWQIRVITKSVNFYKTDLEQVFVMDGKDVKRPLQDYSETIANLTNQQESVCFLYIDSAVVDTKEVNEIIKKCNEHAALIYDE